MNEHWNHAGKATERAAFLNTPFTYDSLVDDICREAYGLRWQEDSGFDDETAGWYRHKFCFGVTESTFDRFFNSPFGYRGQYRKSIRQGERANRTLIARLTGTLVSKVPSVRTEEAERALLSENGRVWIHEKHLGLGDPSLRIEIRIPEWEDSARAAIEAMKDDPDISAYGVRAPLGTTLVVMSAWIDTDGALHQVQQKSLRGQQIHDCGIS